jgi:hypothetical protein
MASNHTQEPPSDQVIRAFGGNGPIKRLTGGEGRSFLADHRVYKPADNPPLHEWCCLILSRVQTQDFRLPTALQTPAGSHIHAGWSAATYEPGEEIKGCWDEKLAVARSFHAAINRLGPPPLPKRTDRWSLSHEVVWGLMPLPENLHNRISTKLHEILGRCEAAERPPGIIHADLCGNILFHEGLKPLVVDFSPAHGPADYGDAILIADAIAWEGAPIDLVDRLPRTPWHGHMLRRAVAFRLMVAGLISPKDPDLFFSEFENFSPVIDALWI